MIVHTLHACALRRRGHADRAPAALRTVHGRERLVPLLLIPEPDEAEAFGGPRHRVGNNLGAENGGILVQEGGFQLGVRNLGRKVSHKNGVFRRLFYALAARAPVQSVAQGGTLCEICVRSHLFVIVDGCMVHVHC